MMVFNAVGLRIVGFNSSEFCPPNCKDHSNPKG